MFLGVKIKIWTVDRSKDNSTLQKLSFLKGDNLFIVLKKKQTTTISKNEQK